MATYLYCLVPATPSRMSPPAPPSGIGGGEVRVLIAGAVEAWVSTVLGPSLHPTLAAIRAHDAVVSAALATGRTPLPARFGQSWPSDDACLASVAQRAGELEPLLRRVAGLVEMTVCTLLPAMPPSPRLPADLPGSSRRGTAYLARLRARTEREGHLRAALEALRRQIGAALGEVSRGENAEINGSDAGLALSLSYLIERDREATFRAAIAQVAHETAAHLVIAGPRAPYSFAPDANATSRPSAGAP